MIVTQKDELIYKYIEENNFATVRQITNAFFSDLLYGATSAKKRLSCLIEHGYIKQTKSTNCNQDIFFVDDKYRKQSKHSILVMDVYSKFYKMENLKIIDFKKEKGFANNKVISDGFINISYYSVGKTIIQSFIIEVQTSKNDYKKVLNKYNDSVIDSDIRAECDGFAPVLIYIDNIKHDMSNICCPYQICQLKESLSDFPLIFGCI